MLTREPSYTVYLSASPQYLYNRLLEEKEKRPLIKKLNPAELLLFVEQKLKDRQSFYELAQLILPVDELNDNSIKKIIIS